MIVSRKAWCLKVRTNFNLASRIRFGHVVDTTTIDGF